MRAEANLLKTQFMPAQASSSHFSQTARSSPGRKIIAFVVGWLLCGWLGHANDILKPAASGSRAPDPVAEWVRTTTEGLNAGSKIAITPYGPIEYAMSGAGPVVLCMHGGPGGYDQSF